MISVKNRKFPTPRVFNAPDEWVLLGIGIGAWVKKLKMMGYRLDTIHECDNVTHRRTGGQMDTRLQQKIMLMHSA